MLQNPGMKLSLTLSGPILRVMCLLGPPFLIALTPLVRNYLFIHISESPGSPGSGTACAKAQM